MDQHNATAPSTVHDASQGFHDIKPLPDFVPTNFVWILAFVLLIALLFLALYLLKRQKACLPVPAPRSPEDVALEQIGLLEHKRAKNEIDIRNLSSSLSLALRGYLEAVFCFPATDLTNREVVEALPAFLKKKLFQLPENTRLEVIATVGRALHDCSFLAFGTNSDSLYALTDSRVTQAITDSITLIQELSRYLKQEAQRVQSVHQVKHADRPL